MRENNTMEKIIPIKVIRIVLVNVISMMLLMSCSYSEASIPTTKLPVEYNNGHIYFYRCCTDSSTEDEFSIIQYDVEESKEREIVKTNVVVGMHVYNNYIYYFDKNYHNLCALNEHSLKSKMVYNLNGSLPKNDYITSGTKIIYLDAGTLIIKDDKEEQKIENVWNFNIYRDQIYYVKRSVTDRNDWSINTIPIQTKNNVKETVILSLREIKGIYEDVFEEYGKIDDISICDDKLYFTVSEYEKSKCCNLFSYDLNNKEVKKAAERFIIEYQATENGVYCLEEDNVLTKYNDENKKQILLEDVYSFKVANNDILMYMKMHEDILHIRTNNGDIAISGVTRGGMCK